MGTKRCKVCGVPMILTKDHQWNSDGTWSTRRGCPLFFQERDALTNLFTNLEKRMGISVEGIIFESKRKAAKGYIDDIFSEMGLMGVIFKNRFLNKIAIEKVSASGRLLGYGVTYVRELKWRTKVVVVIKDAYFIPFMAADVSASFQSICGVRAEVKVEDKEGETIITVEATTKESKIGKYLIPSMKPSLPGNIQYERCPRCGIPKEIAKIYKWDWEHGLLVDTKAGKRWVVIGPREFSAVFGALERELGEEIPKIIMDIEKNYIRDSFPPSDLKGTEEEYRELLEPIYFGIMGWGNPVEVTKRDKNLKVRVDNPFNEPILAGMLGGMYEAIEKVEAEVEWLPNTQGYTIITIGPKGEA